MEEVELIAAPTRPGLDRHGGWRGVWLRSTHAEAFVALTPVFRVLAFRSPGSASLWADHGAAEQGLRLAYMEPEQIPTSFDVGNRPATLVNRHRPSSATVRLEAARGLRYSVRLAVDPARPRLRLRYALENVSSRTRRVAPWSVLSFERRGTALVPLPEDGDEPRGMVRPPWADWPQPGVRTGAQAITATLGGPLFGTAYKVGVACAAGWLALQRGADGLVSSAPYERGTEYPEGGANLTFFEADDRAGRAWCELEHLGPLRTVLPGEATTLSQTVDLFTGLPVVPGSPDALRRLVEARWNGNASLKVAPDCTVR